MILLAIIIAAKYSVFF